MKQLTCEMCGSTDLMKQDGVFVCQFCGCKYSVEEAKKMMIEGTVNVAGTVKVDNSETVEKYLKNARQAYEREDWENAEKYYALAEQDISDLEVIFFRVYCRAMGQLYKTNYLDREQTFNALLKIISTINSKYSNSPEDKKTLAEINNALFKMYKSRFIFSQSAIDNVGGSNWQRMLFQRVDMAFVKELKSINLKYHEKFITEFLTTRARLEEAKRQKIERENRKKNIGAITGSVIGLIVGIIIVPCFQIDVVLINYVIGIMFAWVGALIGTDVGSSRANKS